MKDSPKQFTSKISSKSTKRPPWKSALMWVKSNPIVTCQSSWANPFKDLETKSNKTWYLKRRSNNKALNKKEWGSNRNWTDKNHKFKKFPSTIPSRTQITNCLSQSHDSKRSWQIRAQKLISTRYFSGSY